MTLPYQNATTGQKAMEEFVHMFCAHHECPRDKLVNRIEFEYL